VLVIQHSVPFWRPSFILCFWSLSPSSKVAQWSQPVLFLTKCMACRRERRLLTCSMTKRLSWMIPSEDQQSSSARVRPFLSRLPIAGRPISQSAEDLFLPDRNRQLSSRNIPHSKASHLQQPQHLQLCLSSLVVDRGVHTYLSVLGPCCVSNIHAGMGHQQLNSMLGMNEDVAAHDTLMADGAILGCAMSPDDLYLQILERHVTGYLDRLDLSWSQCTRDRSKREVGALRH
jgi:hypothetical protein